MDFKEYIESGKLECYILGSCTSEELLEAECMARIFPEVRKELEQIRSSLEKYSHAEKVVPPEQLKSKIFAAIYNIEAKKEDIETKILTLEPRIQKNSSGLKYFIAAILTLFIVSGFVIFNLFKKNDKLTASIDELKLLQKNEIEKAATLEEWLKISKQELEIMSNPNSFPVALKGLPLSPQSLTTVYWNRESKAVYLSVNSLPKPQEGKQYQLWGIVNGLPVDLGVFEIPADQFSKIQKMKSVDNASAFAVTLEKSGGSLAPTMSEMYVFGNI